MSYFEAATAGYNLTPCQVRALQVFFRGAESARINLDGFGYHVTIGDLAYPAKLALEDAIEELQGILFRRQLPDVFPLTVVVEAKGDGSWVVDMGHAVAETRYALEKFEQ